MFLRNGWVLFAGLLIAFLFSMPGTAMLEQGQEKPKEEEKEKEKEKDKDKEKEEPEFPKFEDVTKKLEKVTASDGNATPYYILYRKENKLLAEIPSNRLKQPFLLATSIARGTFSGFQWDEMLVQWERLDKQLLLIQPDVHHRAEGGPLAESVKRTYTERVVCKVPILTESPSGGIVIDLVALYAEQAQVFIGFLAESLDASAARVYKAKCFVQNVEVAVDLPMNAQQGFSLFGGGGGSVMTVHYSISELPSTSYKSRYADDRVGYFLTAVKDYTKKEKDDTRFVRYVNRWLLEKADPSLKISPPVKPITFYVEKTVPVRFRRAVHEGILEWNKAFEKVGISGAIEVRQQTDTQFGDLDPEDVNYNFFRWITSDRAFAMGPSRVDPRTGQILDADIIFDDSMIQWFLQDYKILVNEVARSMIPPSLRQYLDEHPRRDPARLAAKPRSSMEGQGFDWAEFERADRPGRIPGDGRKVCALGHGFVAQMALAHLARLAGVLTLGEEEKKDDWPDEFISPVVKEIVMHEVGHTLGLRHNFKASSWRALEEINKKESAPEAISASVMDYNPLNIAPKGTPQGHYVPTTIGPYDYWAIEYGYKPLEGGTPEAERTDLAKIAERVAEKGLAYGTDEDVWFSSDPLINRFDLGDDPLAFAKQRRELIAQIQEKLIDRAVQKGESYYKLRNAFDMVLYEHFYTALTASKYIGGHYMHRDHRGDPNERPPVMVVPIERQRSALAFVKDYVFSDKPFQFSPEFLNKLAASRWWHWGSFEAFSEVNYPIHDQILWLQCVILFRMINPMTLSTVYDGELRVEGDEDAMTLPELIKALSESICSEIFQGLGGSRKTTDRRPMISSLRRNLQREYIAQLIELSLDNGGGWIPHAAKTLAWYELKRIDKVLKSLVEEDGIDRLDTYTRSHLEECHARIQKVLEASFQVGGGGSGASGGSS